MAARRKEGDMRRHTIGGVTGYKPEMLINSMARMVYVYVPGIYDPVAKLPEGTDDAVVTAAGYVHFRTPRGGVDATQCAEQGRVAAIIRCHDEARERGVTSETLHRGGILSVSEIAPLPIREIKASSRAGLGTTATKTVDVSCVIETIRKQADAMTRMQRRYDDAIAALQGTLDAALAEIARLKSEAAQRAPQRPGEESDGWVGAHGLRDGGPVVAVDGNPFVRVRR
jgi:hypothetical protein